MSRVTDALDAFLGTPSYRGGAVVKNRNGVFTDGDGLDLDASLESIIPRSTDVDPCSPHHHDRLRGARCHGCGRTRNEILLDEGN
jgi:hypothetical protein